MPNLLIELGTEEMPISGLTVVYDHLIPEFEKKLRAERLAFDAVFCEATPRRIAVFVEGLAAKQEDAALEQTGPMWEKAYDSSGKPTQALLGFLKSRGASPEAVTAKETPKGKFVCLVSQVKGKTAAALIPEIITEVLQKLPFPKWMRWEAGKFRFPRPLRWAAVLLDRRAVSFNIADIKTGNKSFGHRFLSPNPFKILEADWQAYQRQLKTQHVILSLPARMEMIRKGLVQKFGQNNPDPELIKETAQLVEEPFLMQGSFKKSYLKLPSEVLASCMKKNQKIFACYDRQHRPAAKFVSVLNGRRKNPAHIRTNYENVLESRLKDACYFFEADTREPLASKRGLLEQITYLGKLGTMMDKVSRLENLAGSFAPLSGHDNLHQALKRTAHLAKIDLMTQLVFEMPDLQGIMGREYALASGEPKDVAQAIGTQYLPKNLSEDYRELKKQLTPLGALFGIMDRFDLLAGAFGSGISVSGSQDPYALRRAAGSLVKILRAHRFHFSNRAVLKENSRLYGQTLSVSPAELEEKLGIFLQERMAFELGVRPGERAYEIFQAVCASSFDDLSDVFDRFEILEGLCRKDPKQFMQTAKVVERTGNILKGAKSAVGDTVEPSLFESDLESQLFDLWGREAKPIADLLNAKDYRQATERFGGAFYGPLGEYFEKVMVNAEKPEIRANRQAMMKRINHLYTSKLADLSLLSRLDEV